jgi:AP-4 complex subunit epsilon-1
MVKRFAYSILSMFLHPQHELLLLMVNTLQRDLHSENAYDIAMAMDVISEIINLDMMNALIEDVEGLLHHSSALVRRKAITLMKSMFKINPEKIMSYIRPLKQCLGDADVLVMQCAGLFYI